MIEAGMPIIRPRRYARGFPCVRAILPRSTLSGYQKPLDFLAKGTQNAPKILQPTMSIETINLFYFNMFKDYSSMNCIDAVEGTVKYILTQLHAAHQQVCCDDSEYIHQVKTVIDATGTYVEQNPEFIQDPSILKQVLYLYSRDLWLQEQQPGEMSQKSPRNGSTLEIDDYQTYYYDYVYNRGVYPN